MNLDKCVKFIGQRCIQCCHRTIASIAKPFTRAIQFEIEIHAAASKLNSRFRCEAVGMKRTERRRNGRSGMMSNLVPD